MLCLLFFLFLGVGGGGGGIGVPYKYPNCVKINSFAHCSVLFQHAYFTCIGLLIAYFVYGKYQGGGGGGVTLGDNDTGPHLLK